jgi:hypothetical protein
VSEEATRKRQKRLVGMRRYWNTLSQVVGDESIGVWKQLEGDSLRMKVILLLPHDTFMTVFFTCLSCI